MSRVVEQARRAGLPPVWRGGVETFYELLREPGSARRCSGTACTFARGPEGPPVADLEVHCLGRCYDAPAATDRDAAPIPRTSLLEPPVVLRHVLGAEPTADRDFDLPDGETILDAVVESGLRGRGGAAYPPGAKWRVARDTPAADRYVVANGDEGDPGAYVDRLLLEEAPDSVLAGMLACARAIGAGRGIVFIRGEYPEARRRMEAAVGAARSRGRLGSEFDVEVIAGSGSYVAGEETALLRAIEGLRAEPSPKPPYPAKRGLHGMPTVIQNVETLSLIPWVVANRRAADAKAVCLSGTVARPGVVEVALGTPLRDVLEKGGGGEPRGRRWKMALVGGPMGHVVPAREFDVPLSYEAFPGMGHAGVVVLDESVSAGALARHLYRFAASESCGNCAPCRIGTGQLARQRDRAALERLLDTLEIGSLCGFGQGVPRPLRDLLKHYPDELFR